MLLKDAIVRSYFLLAMDMTVLSPKATEGQYIANQEGGLALAQSIEDCRGLGWQAPVA